MKKANSERVIEFICEHQHWLKLHLISQISLNMYYTNAWSAMVDRFHAILGGEDSNELFEVFIRNYTIITNRLSTLKYYE